MLTAFQKQASAGWKLVTLSMLKEIEKEILQEKLQKSDLPKIEIDLSGPIRDIIQKYTAVLQWMLLGKFAGKEAEKIAKSTDFFKKLPAGIIPAAYLHSIDMNKMFYEKYLDKKKEKVPSAMVEESLKELAAKSSLMFESFELSFRNSILSRIDILERDVNAQNANKFRKKLIDDESIKEARKTLKENISKTSLNKEIKNVTNKYKNRWDTVVVTDTEMASGIATHQSITEIFGQDEKEMYVAYMTMEDDRVTPFCKHMSKDSSGKYKIYKLSSLKPAGYNLGRPKADWKLSVAPNHYNCRSWIIYVPKGFEVLPGGVLSPKQN